MDNLRIAGLLLILGALGILLSTFLNAPGLYQTDDIESRLAILDEYRSRWLTSQAVVTIGSLLMTAGFIALSLGLRSRGSTWLAVGGGSAMVLGTLSGLYFIYLQVTDPRGGYSGVYPLPESLTYWLWLIGLLLIGIALLQAGLPRWIGYLSVGSAVGYSIVYALTGAGFMTPFILALLAPLLGIVLLRG